VYPSQVSHIGLLFGLAFIVVGVAFKFGAVPFHMWLPDVYHGAPTAVTLFVGSAPKIASFALAMRVLAEGLGGLTEAWQDMLVVLAVLSMLAGNLIAIAQTNIKRMLAYSTISHVGFILLGILAGTVEGYQAAMFYTLTYVIMATGGFGVILLLSRKGFEADTLDDYKGLNQKSPWFAFVMLVLMFGMAGVPPMVGFWAKVQVISAVLDVGLTWLAAAGRVPVGNRRLLLPARREAHVLRRARRFGRGRGRDGPALGALRQRAAGGAARRHARLAAADLRQCPARLIAAAGGGHM
jgi:NADH-quinone oxidoreductase subunit N